MPKSQSINITKSANAISLWGHDFALDAYSFNLNLVADTPQSVAVPLACNTAIISYMAAPSVWISLAAFTPPGAGAQTNQSAFCNKASLHVQPGETLHFLSLTDNDINVSFYDNQDGQLG